MRGWILIGLFGMMTGCGDNGGSMLEQVASGVAESAGNLSGAIKAKRTECASNINAIKTALMVYDATYDAFVPAAAHPATVPGEDSADWGNGNEGFQTLGWAPNGQVRGQYSVTTTALDFQVRAICDVDGDGVHAIYTATKSISPVLTTPENVY